MVSRRRAGTARASMSRLVALLIIVALTMAGAAVCGCGSSSEGSDTGEGNGGGGDETQLSSPDDLGEQIIALYKDAMNDVVALMDGYPDVATLKPQVEQTREDYIQQMIALGKQKEQLSEEERTTVDMVVTEGLGMVSGEELYQTYVEGQAHYLSQDIELGNLIADFNIITQYADFELLRSQDPEEAERLGL